MRAFVAEPHHAVRVGSCVVFSTETNDMVYVGDIQGSGSFYGNDRVAFFHPVDFEDLMEFTDRRRKERVEH